MTQTFFTNGAMIANEILRLAKQNTHHNQAVFETVCHASYQVDRVMRIYLRTV